MIRDMVNKAVERYKVNLEQVDDKASKKMLKEWSQNFNEEYLDIIVQIYLEKCKLRYSLAFIQFRKILPKAKVSYLKEVFTDRVQYIERLIKVNNVIAKKVLRKKNYQIPIPPLLEGEVQVNISEQL